MNKSTDKFVEFTNSAGKHIKLYLEGYREFDWIDVNNGPSVRTVRLYNGSPSYNNLDDAILFLQALREMIPEESRKNTFVFLNSERSHYDSIDTKLEVSYHEKESPEATKIRHAAAEKRVAEKRKKDKENAEKSERALYEKLKKKFESGT